jgi:hypothetical protein
MIDSSHNSLFLMMILFLGVNHERDFPLIVGNEQYFCPTVLAALVSPPVSGFRSQSQILEQTIPSGLSFHLALTRPFPSLWSSQHKN